MNLLLDFHDFFIVLFRLKGSSCIRSVSLSQASWLRVAKYHFAVTQYSLIPASASRWPTQNPGFVCPAVVNLWYMIRTQPYLQNTKQPRDMLLEPDISLTEKRMPTQGGKHTPGKENTVKWKENSVREKRILWFVYGCLFILLASCWFGKHVIQSGKSDCWYEWLKFCSRLWQLKSGHWIQAVISFFGPGNDTL